MSPPLAGRFLTTEPPGKPWGAFQKSKWGTSLVVQWFGLWMSTAGSWGLIPHQGTKPESLRYSSPPPPTNYLKIKWKWPSNNLERTYSVIPLSPMLSLWHVCSHVAYGLLIFPPHSFVWGIGHLLKASRLLHKTLAFVPLYPWHWAQCSAHNGGSVTTHQTNRKVSRREDWDAERETDNLFCSIKL